MTTFVLTVIGDDRAGLVKALADVIAANGGNWERSRLSELAGKFAGIVEVSVPPEREGDLRAALEPLEGLLEVSVRPGAEAAAEPTHQVQLHLVGNDAPGIVQAVSGVFAARGLSVADLVTELRDAPMAGGRLFEADALVSVPTGADLDAVRADLERLATEIMVDVDVVDAARD
ncbi:glycine cleavage system protein R [Janibacter sp. G56]|uniref:glycine cleavage system protein R n=1 Tax=Janibacter sp. G56 TaxID=3418717 RepID=UPI003CFF0D06